MAGKSSKSKSRGKGSSDSFTSEPFPTSRSNFGDADLSHMSRNEDHSSELSNKDPEAKGFLGSTDTAQSNQSKLANGDLNLCAVPVKVQSVGNLELHLSPRDSVMDIRQFLLDSPETCFFTSYDLLLHTKDGLTHHLADYKEISDLGDITTGGCSLEMIAASYDDRSIRSHVRRARELLSCFSLHSSLSTSLALQHELTKNMATDNVLTKIPELDGLGFMDDTTGSLHKLVSPSYSSREIRCLESVVFSSFNPPPGHRRLVGDLIYLDVVTLEGHEYCVTGATRTFFVNSSKGHILNPRPASPLCEASTLIGLLQKLSAKFRKGFREILERKASSHPFENVQSLLPANPWLGEFPIPDHKRDATRAEDALTCSYGSELIGMQRDWNDELQSCRELPHNTLQERILRNRALYKVTCDFVDAAVSGAVGVVNRCVPPINPTDPECFHMYIHNNIFFSFAVDADMKQLRQNGVSETASNAPQDVEDPENAGSSLVLIDAIPSNGSHCDPYQEKHSVANAKIGVKDVLPIASSEGQMLDNEQATYASANNDLKGTKAFQEADVPGLYNLAMAIIDFRGHRVVAQSIIPGILHGDKSESLLYGSVDNGKKIYWNEAFHSKVLEAAKRLHLKEHTVRDLSGNAVRLAAPVECKGIVGSDDRHYLLDLMRVTPRDANFISGGDQCCVLRPELLSAFCQAEALEKHTVPTEMASSDPNCIDDGSSWKVGSGSFPSASKGVIELGHDHSVKHIEEAVVHNLCHDMALNPNVFTEFHLADSKEVIAADEEVVRKASGYLVDVAIPKFVGDICLLEVSPMDGQTLTEALHAHGINVRYIGKIAEMTKHLPHVWDLCVLEIAVRSAKHIIKDLLRESQDHEVGPAIAHFFNCVFGAVLDTVRSKYLQEQARRPPLGVARKKSESRCGKYIWKNEPGTYLRFFSDCVWSDIHEFARLKYQFELPQDVRTHVKKISAVRNLCQKMGVVIAARDYSLEASAPFETSDIVNLLPVVKHSVPICFEARDLIETGKIKLADGMLNEAYTLFSEAFTILQQVTGPMHQDVANCCRYLAMVLYHGGDMAGAIMQQHKELIINERCLGLDHPDTVHSYGNMALFYHGLNQIELALQHMSRTLLLLGFTCGPDHPDVAATFINVAMMYQDIGKTNIALRYIQESLKKTERLLGPEHVQTAHCYHALAIAFNFIGAYKLSLQHERKTYNILVKQLGESDSRTVDSKNWIEAFKLRDCQVNAQKQKGMTVKDILKAHFQTSTSRTGNRNLSTMLLGNTLAHRRGSDERAAKAVAEVRRKAAARGLHITPHVGPLQALPALTHLIHVISPRATYGQTDDSATKVNSSMRENGDVVVTDQHIPVGLGMSLAPLELKKHKPNA